jgi:DNA polymerase alpha subunit B
LLFKANVLLCRLGRLASHLLSQRSFYPLYPPSEEQNIDLEHQEAHGLLNTAPHLLLLPSDLVHFARDLETGTTVLNPGRVTKGPGPGTWARVRARSSPAAGVQIKAEIMRI